jgi:outer membrane protease
MRFVDEIAPAPVLGAAAGMSYAVTDNLEISARAEVKKVFKGRGDTQILDVESGASLGMATGTADADLFSAAVAVSVNYRF